jgi:hypothetical protein
MKRLFFTLLAIHSLISAQGQDIVVSMNGPTTIAQYQEIENEIVLKNEGIVSIQNYFSTTLYLSTDRVGDFSDTFLGSLGTNGLSIGTSDIQKLFNASIKLPPGDYYLIINADYNNYVVETDESNNTQVIPIVVSAPNVDFVFTSFTIDKTAYKQNESIVPTFTIENAGAVNVAGLLNVGIFLSSDQIISSDDKEIYDWGSMSLLLKGTDTKTSEGRTRYLSVPSVSPGNYFIIVSADNSLKFDELNEGNNVAILPISVEASNVDLEITNVEIFNPNLSTQEALTGFARVKNNGSTQVGGIWIAASLAAAGFPAITSQFAEGPVKLQPGESTTVNFHSPPMYNTNPGIYSLELTVNPNSYINSNRQILETDYSNNTFVFEYINVFLPPPPNVTLTTVGYNGSYDNTDTMLQLDLGLTNSGNTSWFPQSYQVEIKDASNAIVHSQYVDTYVDFPPSISSVKSTTISLPNVLPPGQYQTIVTCMSTCYTTFVANSTVLTINQIQYTVNGTIKGEDGNPISRGNLFLYQKGNDGVVKFVQKITPTTTPDFTFLIDDHEHTLYFIPDRQAYPQYVPTVFGKTPLLQGSSFFTLTQDSLVEFEILKINSLASGPGIISGNVGQASPSNVGARVDSGTPLPSVSVLLLSSSGQVVGYTMTDDNGYYEFKDLPRDNYQVVLSQELDIASMTQATTVDVTSKNAEVNFLISPSGGVTVTKEILYLPQQITFAKLADAKYGQLPFILNATSNAGLPVSFSSSDLSIAEINDGNVSIVGVGEVNITATQQGNDFYLPSVTSQKLVVNKGDQSITFPFLPTKKFGDLPFGVQPTSSTGLPVELTSSNPAIATITGQTITIHQAGEVTISASQNGNGLYNAAQPIDRLLVISRSSQTISFDPLPEKKTSDASFELMASSSSSLKIAFSSDNPEVATVSGNIVTIHKAGVTNIIATQSGDTNFLSAPPITRALVVNLILGVEDLNQRISVYPNPTSDFAIIENDQNVETIHLCDALGKETLELLRNENRIDLRSFSPGVYYLKIQLKNVTQMFRVIKQ